MDVFTTGIIVLLVMTAIFFIVLFSFIYYWHNKKTTYVILPAVFTFEFFISGFFIVATVSIIINYLPEVIRLLGI